MDVHGAEITKWFGQKRKREKGREKSLGDPNRGEGNVLAYTSARWT